MSIYFFQPHATLFSYKYVPWPISCMRVLIQVLCLQSFRIQTQNNRGIPHCFLRRYFALCNEKKKNVYKQLLEMCFLHPCPLSPLLICNCFLQLSQRQERSLNTWKVSFLIHIAASKPFISPKAFKTHNSFEAMPSCYATHILVSLLYGSTYKGPLSYWWYFYLTTYILSTLHHSSFLGISAAMRMTHQKFRFTY